MKLCNGKTFEIPMFDPLVAAHFNNANSCTGTLLHQIEVDQTYAEFFEGKKDLTFLDIGANIGLVSIYAAPACKRIVAIEPAPETFEVLKALTHRFHEPQIEIVQAALSHTDGTVEFFVNDLNSTASSTVNTYGTRTEVRGMTLTSILSVHQLEKVDVCKIDAEGAEGESLNPLELEKAAAVVQTFFVETHNCPESTWERKMGCLVQYFCRLGYHKQRINGMALVASKV